MTRHATSAVLLATAACTAALALTACTGSSSTSSGSGSSAAAPTSTATATDTAAAAPAATGTSATPSGAASSAAPTSAAPTAPPSAKPTVSAPPASTPAAARPTIILESDGLGFLVGASSIRHFPFRTTSAATILTALGNALGGPLTTNDQPDCGQGARKGAQRAGFSVLFNGTTFVGWVDQGATGRTLSTADGIGIGSTLTQVQSRLPKVQTADNSLGPEFFSSNSFGGLLDGLKPTSKATLVYAGETCFFR